MKLDDIPFVIHDINKEMPIFTENKIIIPHTFGHWPKDMQNYSSKVNDKFLNRHLAVIEEIAHRYPNHDMPKWMKAYQIRQFKAHLGHDGFFKTNFDHKMLQRVGNTSSWIISFPPHVNGATLETTATTDTNEAYFTQIALSKATGGTIGQFYNQIAAKIGAQAGNIIEGAYVDSSGPTTLYKDSGSIACPVAGDYSFKSLTEFALTSSAVWIGFENDNNAMTIAELSAQPAGSTQYGTHTYGSPWSSPVHIDNPSYTKTIRMKLGHS